MSDDAIPASPDAYQPTLPQIDGVPAGTRIGTSHPRYREAAAQAHKAGLSQRQFSAFLGFEAQRVAAAAKAAPPAKATPAAPAKPTASATDTRRQPPDTRPYKQLSMAEKLNRFGHH